MADALLAPIFIPLAAAALVILAPGRIRRAKEIIALAATALTLAACMKLFAQDLACSMPWAGFGFELSFRAYRFSEFIICSVALLGLLVAIYSAAFMRDRQHAGQFYAYLLISIGMANGAVLADNLVAMLFFWEGMLLTLFGMIAIGSPGAFRAATKAFVIVGICDLCMMAGIAVAGHLAHTLTISKIHIASTGLGGLAFVLLMIGAISKAGSMPFHSWIPDAAISAPLPFMAIMPAALEKLLGIYFLARISLDMFALDPHSWPSTLMMAVGCITIVGAVMMALIQKDYKRLLSYHAVSQVGYMILGIGTLVPAGIVGGLFHMINNALYKSCLFLTGGSVEKQAGTTDLEELGGMGKMMPVTFACFLITALSISGVPPFNGFFSKELVYEGALERGWWFYLAALLGSFLTAASFLKLGHAVFLGKAGSRTAREAPIAMLIPMVIIAGLCILFGIWNALPIRQLIQPVLGNRLEGHDFAGMPASVALMVGTAVVLIAAAANHFYGVKRTGSAAKAADHIHYAPVLRSVYAKAEKGRLDPYNIGMAFAEFFASAAAWCDAAINWIYDDLVPGATGALSAGIRRLHDGSYRTYIVWSVAAAAVVIIIMLNGLR